MRPILTLCLILNAFNPIHANEKQDIVAELKKQKQSVENKHCPQRYHILDMDSVKQKIACLWEVDQYIANHTINHRDNKAVQYFLQEINETGGEELKKIMHHHGWPIISKFGKKTDIQAWLLVQHADYDPLFQAGVAFLLAQLVEKGETNKHNYAFLFDRVALKYQSLGLKQKYGTQFTISENDIILQPYEGSLDQLNANRKKMGLESVEIYLNRSKAFYLK